MVNDANRPSFSPFQEQSELELLHLILQGVDHSPYPWNPGELGATSYFEDLEQEVVTLGWTDEDYAPYVQALSQQLDQAWSSLQSPTAAPVGLRVFSAELIQRLSDRVPQHLLESIAQQAKQALARNLSLADQMVMCVQDILPAWGAEDLLVLARPFAYSMRGPAETDLLDSTLRTLRSTTWTELSEIEQARLSLAIARYALSQAPESEAN